MQRIEPDYRHTRSISDIDSSWLEDYLLRHYGSEDEPTCVSLSQFDHGDYILPGDGLDWVMEAMGNSQWRKMRAAWRKHKQRTSPRNQLMESALKDLSLKAGGLGVEPHELLQALLMQLADDYGRTAVRNVEVIRSRTG